MMATTSDALFYVYTDAALDHSHLRTTCKGYAELRRSIASERLGEVGVRDGLMSHRLRTLELPELPALRCLVLDHNLLEELAAPALPALRSLDVTHNRLAELDMLVRAIHAALPLSVQKLLKPTVLAGE